ncbi:hypothetical protein IKF89_00170 [Candidatus Saccharibacteria bacterium]|nr:hypothetical protein [Candidatus Saccharibacteria bacterium]
MDYGKEQKFDLDQYNLDTDEWDYSPERDARALGNKIISSPNTPNIPGAIDTTPPEVKNLPNTEQAPPLMPPSYPQEPALPQAQTSPDAAELSMDSPIALLVKKAQSSEKFTYHDAKIAETSINSELAQTGDIATVYEEIRASSVPAGESV